MAPHCGSEPVVQPARYPAGHGPGDSGALGRGRTLMAGNPHLSHVSLKVEGALVSPDVMQDLLEVTVDHSLHLPSMFTLRLFNHDMKWLRDETFREGKKVEIFFGERSRSKLLSGKIAGLEPKLEAVHPTVMVRGYDLSHKLYRGRHRRS